MKKLLFGLIVATIVAFGIQLLTLPIHASGSLTTSTGSAVVRTEDGVMYVSTEDEGDQASTSQGTFYFSFLGSPIQIPEGFAQDIGRLLTAVLSFVMVIATMLVFFYLIMGAFNWITSGGDKGKVDQARQKIIAAVVGLIIVASSYAILLLAINFLGFNSLDDVFDGVMTIQGKSARKQTELGALNQSATSSATTK